MRKKNTSLPFWVGHYISCVITAAKSLYHKSQAIQCCRKRLLLLPITISLGILVILVLGVGDHIWLSRYPYISRGPSQCLFSTGGKWTILDMEREYSHKKTLLSLLRPSPDGKESGLPIMFLLRTNSSSLKATSLSQRSAIAMGKIIRTYSLRLSFIPFLACFAFLNPKFY